MASGQDRPTISGALVVEMGDVTATEVGGLPPSTFINQPNSTVRGSRTRSAPIRYAAGSGYGRRARRAGGRAVASVVWTVPRSGLGRWIVEVVVEPATGGGPRSQQRAVLPADGRQHVVDVQVEGAGRSGWAAPTGAWRPCTAATRRPARRRRLHGAGHVPFRRCAAPGGGTCRTIHELRNGQNLRKRVIGNHVPINDRIPRLAECPPRKVSATHRASSKVSTGALMVNGGRST
jgi:hypothetical protein